MKKKKLTANQKIFCDEYVIDRNSARAYKAAFNSKSIKACRNGGYRLLAFEHIKKYIDTRLKLISEEAKATAVRVVAEECRIAYMDMRKIFDGDDAIIPPSELPADVAAAISNVTITERIVADPLSGKEGVVLQRTFKYTFWNKGQALERLSKNLGLYKEDNKQKEGSGLDKLAEIMGAVDGATRGIPSVK